MTALIVILAVFVLLFIISLLRFGAEFEYSGEGMYAACICGPLKIKLIPPSDKPKKEKKQKNKKEKKVSGKRRSDVRKNAEKKGGTLSKVKAVLPTAVKTMGRFFKHLRIDELTLLFVITDDDPYKAALNYGYVSGTMAPLVTLINQSFKIKKWDVRAFPSFTECEETVYIKAKATIALWEIVYIIAKLDFKAIFSIF